MPYSTYDVCLYAVPVGEATYPRPCVIVQIVSDSLALLAVSTKQYSNHQCFVIDKGHPDFGATGLTETSYVFGSPVIEARNDKIIRKLGTLDGGLKRDFIEWIG
jgi:hypothetical protein